MINKGEIKLGQKGELLEVDILISEQGNVQYKDRHILNFDTVCLF